MFIWHIHNIFAFLQNIIFKFNWCWWIIICNIINFLNDRFDKLLFKSYLHSNISKTSSKVKNFAVWFLIFWIWKSTNFLSSSKSAFWTSFLTIFSKSSLLKRTNYSLLFFKIPTLSICLCDNFDVIVENLQYLDL